MEDVHCKKKTVALDATFDNVPKRRIFIVLIRKTWKTTFVNNCYTVTFALIELAGGDKTNLAVETPTAVVLAEGSINYLRPKILVRSEIQTVLTNKYIRRERYSIETAFSI